MRITINNVWRKILAKNINKLMITQTKTIFHIRILFIILKLILNIKITLLLISLGLEGNQIAHI